MERLVPLAPMWRAGALDVPTRALRMFDFTGSDNPLLSNSIQVWDDLIEAVDPASLLVLIERKLSRPLAAQYAPEDIFQESLLHAWRDRHQCQWQGLRHFRAWLISIIDHRIHDAADRAGAQKRGGGSPLQSFREPGESTPGADVPVDSRTPSRIAMFKEQAAAMQEALTSLPSELTDVVRLRLFDQLPLDRIADRLGISVAAVRHRFRKGLEIYQRRLRTALVSRSGAASVDVAPLPPGDSSSHE